MSKTFPICFLLRNYIYICSIVTVSHHSNKRNLKPCNDLRRETLNDLQGFFYLIYLL